MMRHTRFFLGLLFVAAAACGDNGHVVADRGLGSAGSSASGGSATGAAGRDDGGSVETGGTTGEKDETGGRGDAGTPSTGGRGDGGGSTGGAGYGGTSTTGGRGDGGSMGGEGDGGSATGGRGSGGASATGGRGDGGSTGGGDGGASTTGGRGDGGSTGGSASGGSGDGGAATGGQGDGGTTATGGQGTGGNWIVPNCGYKDIPGKGTITSIEPATEADGNLCDNGSVSVRYEFLPDDTSLSPDEYDVATVNMDPVRYHQLFTNSAQLIPPACVDLLGLEVGDQYTVVRKIAISGSCTPAMDSFSDLDLSSCASLCL
ncbi:MAG: hypothetical protein JW940_24420 [Polyangiaceae bacterium]|nr:hypothetical protein [Polyangiaceae bacterium]